MVANETRYNFSPMDIQRQDKQICNKLHACNRFTTFAGNATEQTITYHRHHREVELHGDRFHCRQHTPLPSSNDRRRLSHF